MRKDGTNGGDDGVCGGRDGREVVVLVGCGSWLIGVVVSGCGGGGLGSCSALIGGSIGAVTAGCAMGAMVLLVRCFSFSWIVQYYAYQIEDL